MTAKTWISQNQNISGVYSSGIFTDPLIYVKVSATVPGTWQLAGNIYFTDAFDADNLLLIASEMYFNMTHSFTLPNSQSYKILFRPVRYLKEYTIDIGRE